MCYKIVGNIYSRGCRGVPKHGCKVEGTAKILYTVASRE
jgi:hypothetical protein